ncbi:MAG TPA: cytochrome c biogenesis protein CcdA [Methanothrix sp.]|jgi:cytochrome c-type biogenesis protein|nr:cytochrome c biogenesis protein CcdA [Methanothrix sp.]HQE87292.1 cytochrome c biogenesis protein CcdA [Methanothrix sp.]HQI67702.1 cytochrome c biogenesis protein CcdA [Methanothrix sp.]HRS85830.1 cytochrome c biogenesis protein CcdA [Methanothrix sp.]HRT17890.1 cytochrome c biogenesis protein CcdA [Methanothrix sp.]
MTIKCEKSLISGSITLFTVLCFILFLVSCQAFSQETKALAPDFQAVDCQGRSLSLSDYRGESLLLHITNIENPLCRECEHVLSAQTGQLSLLAKEHPEINIVTLNIRKNPYSKSGPALAKEWWNINITWPWIEDFEPYTITGKYIGYSTFEDGFANPTLILVDKEGNVAGLYHVYQLGKGEIDGVQSAEALYKGLKEMDRGEAKAKASGFKGVASREDVNYLGMFFLGIVTSLSPCSVALLLAMFSYVMTSRRKEEYLRKSASASKEGFMIGVAFTLGMAAVFFVVGLFLSDIGVFIRQASFFDLAAGMLMIVLGINIIKPIGEIVEPVSSRIYLGRGSRDALSGENDPVKMGLMERLVRFSMGLFHYSAFIGAFALGVFFAMGWAPCAVSLVFPVLIWLISQNVTAVGGGLMLFVFGVGHGVPVIPIATFSRAVGGWIGEKYIAAGKYITMAFGLAVIGIGLIYAVRYFGFKLW